MIEICIEKFAGVILPETPSYTHVTRWPLVLEKGPIWIRGTEEQVVVTPADVNETLTAYQNAGAFWVFGYFAYRSLLDERIERKFIARWDQANGFVPDNRPGYS